MCGKKYYLFNLLGGLIMRKKLFVNTISLR